MMFSKVLRFVTYEYKKVIFNVSLSGKQGVPGMDREPRFVVFEHYGKSIFSICLNSDVIFLVFFQFVNEYERAVIFRLGRLVGVGPGARACSSSSPASTTTSKSTSESSHSMFLLRRCVFLHFTNKIFSEGSLFRTHKFRIPGGSLIRKWNRVR